MTRQESIAYARTFIGTRPNGRACAHCGAPVAAGRRRYCSLACQLAAERVSQRVRQARLLHARHPRPPCQRCGRTIPWGKRRRYCTSVCEDAVREERQQRSLAAFLARKATQQAVA